MKKKTLYILWAALFALCAGLGFVSEPGEGMKALMFCATAAFFVTPAWLLWKGNRQDAYMIRNLSLASLALTAVMLIVNLLSVQSRPLVGDVLYAIMAVVSAPMLCSRFWALSLFCWACLMIVGWKKLRKH